MRTRKEVRAVIYDIKDEEIFILLVRRLGTGWDNQLWRLVKGGKKDYETEEEALIREIHEETGIKMNELEIMEKLYESSYRFKNVQHLVSTYPVKTKSRKALNYDLREIGSYCWFHIDRVIGKLHLKDEKNAVRYLERRLCKHSSKKLKSSF